MTHAQFDVLKLGIAGELGVSAIQANWREHGFFTIGEVRCQLCLAEPTRVPFFRVELPVAAHFQRGSVRRLCRWMLQYNFCADRANAGAWTWRAPEDACPSLELTIDALDPRRACMALVRVVDCITALGQQDFAGVLE